MIEAAMIKGRYYAQARRYLKEHGDLELATQDELEKLAEYLRWQDFFQHIQPYLSQKTRLLSNYFCTRTHLSPQIPADLEKALAEWDDMIDIEARKFGYEGAPTL